MCVKMCSIMVIIITFYIELEWLTNTYNLKECEKWLSAAAKAQAEVMKKEERLNVFI